MKQPAYIGIDPGITGVAVLISNDLIDFYEFTDVRSAALNINIWRVEYDIQGVVLENPGLYIAPGRMISGKMIKNLGQWEGVLAAYYFDYELVAPVTWQKKYKTLYPGTWKTKDRTIRIARHLFPEMIERIYLKKHEHQADALLIANYCKDIFSHGGDQMQLPQDGRGRQIKA